MSTKTFWQKVAAWIAELKDLLNSPHKPKLPGKLPEVEKPVTPTAPVKCACDLSTPFLTPPYSPSVLAAGGNKYECPTIAGRDVRLACKRSDAPTPWLLGNLLPLAVTFNGNNMAGKCFTADGGEYHFIGYSRKFDGSDFINTSAGTEFPYKTTTFVWYEWRAK
jgi:hypothetical protein